MDSNHFNTETVSALIDEVRRAAPEIPLYSVTGNHEWWSSRYEGLIRPLLLARAVVLLENRAISLHRKGGVIRLIGLDDPARYPPVLERSRYLAELGRIRFPDNDEDPFTILLAHRPEYLAEYADAGIDLILAGHAHGGQFRLPAIDAGLFAPGQGFLPLYTTGPYRLGRSVLVVSRGLGNSIIPVRVYNRPEIVTLVLVSGKPESFHR